MVTQTEDQIDISTKKSQSLPRAKSTSPENLNKQLSGTRQDIKQVQNKLNQLQDKLQQQQDSLQNQKSSADTKVVEETKETKKTEDELAEVAPLLDEINRTLAKFDKIGLNQIRYLRKPAAPVVKAMELLCVMFEKRPISLKSDSPLKPRTAVKNFNTKTPPTVNSVDPNGYFELARSELLQNPVKLLKMMTDYDKDNIKEEVVERANKTRFNTNFNLDQIASSSQACAELAKWAIAVLKYNEATSTLQSPKKANKLYAQ